MTTEGTGAEGSPNSVSQLSYWADAEDEADHQGDNGWGDFSEFMDGQRDELDDDNEWYDLEFDIADFLQPSMRKEAMHKLRTKIQDRLRAQLTPRRILLRDKLTFTLGTMDLFVSAYWLGARPQEFYKLYTVKAIVLLVTRWIHYRAKRWHYYVRCFDAYMMVISFSCFSKSSYYIDRSIGRRLPADV